MGSGSGSLSTSTSVKPALLNKVVAFYNVGGAVTYDPASLQHPVWVAGAVASQDAIDKGVAPGALIVSSASGINGAGTTRDRNVIRAADWAATRPARTSTASRAASRFEQSLPRPAIT
jgi:hypothetical protein